MTRVKRSILGLSYALLVAGAAANTFAGAAAAAGTNTAGGTAYGGFTTGATAVPVRIELYEPAIPIPSSPQVELNYSYTKVTGSSGPDSTALASAMWPGESVGTGLPSILSTAGLPPNLLGGGYPVQVNAQYPSQPNSGSQEFLPGMVGRVSAGSEETVARAGYSTSGHVAGDPTSGDGISSVLGQLQSGNLGALGSLLGGPNSNSDSGGNPLGLLSAVVSVSGMSSSSVTDYSDTSTVTATGTSQIGTIELLGGLVKLEGVTVSSSSSSSLDGGAKAKQKITYGGMTIRGQAFRLTSNGIEAAGNTTAVPDTSAINALGKLGITVTLPKPTQTIAGSQVTASATGPTITIDTQPIIALLQLNKLPLASIINQLPASANQLKGLVLAALQAHPKIVVKLGDTSSSAQTVGSVGAGDGGPGPGGSGSGTSSGGGGSATTSGGDGGSAGTPSTTAPDAGAAPASAAPASSSAPPIAVASAVPGLPSLGSVPSLLTLGGLLIAAALGWFFRAAALTALGAGNTCTHGLVTGLPDLRKA